MPRLESAEDGGRGAELRAESEERLARWVAPHISVNFFLFWGMLIFAFGGAMTGMTGA
jgi:hypothetical protein